MSVEVTGMTEEKQEEVQRSRRASPKDAAKELYKEEGEQARKTPAVGRDSEQYHAPGRTRTCDPQLRRLLLYPAELRALDCAAIT